MNFQQQTEQRKSGLLERYRAGIAAFVVILLTMILAVGWTQVPTGAVGIVRTAGKIQPSVLLPGVYFYWFSKVEYISTKDVPFVLENQAPQTKETLSMAEVDIDVFVRVNPAFVVPLVIKYQGDLVQLKNTIKSGKDVVTTDADDLYVVNYNRIMREGRDALYRTFAEYDAKDINASRGQIATNFTAKLQKSLDASDPGAFIVADVSVRKLEADATIAKTVADRAKAAQAIEVEQLLIKKAEVEAQRLIVTAEGQAKANRILSESLTPALTQLKMKEMELMAMRELATKPGNVIMLGNGGTAPVVQMGK
jgi:regulator of protease activity HflC (stomatin/prohibitin superfamily)